MQVHGPGAPRGHRSPKNFETITQAISLNCEAQTAEEGTHHQGRVFKCISSQEVGLPGGGDEREWTEDRGALC